DNATTKCHPSSLLMAATPTAIPTLSLHDALPIYRRRRGERDGRLRPRDLEGRAVPAAAAAGPSDSADPRHQPSVAGSGRGGRVPDRKSTRLNSSHLVISYAVFCLKKKNVAILFDV